ncbi:hypothetical protein JMUB5695_03982 [Mycobacterium heckeshornense]|nr:hypothetical protein JMUB5695_03982 [Mycobacterium heckeshornense]
MSDSLALMLDAEAVHNACSVVTAISVGFSLAPPAEAEVFRFPW